MNTMNLTGSHTATYQYDADGIRQSKTVDGITITHVLDGTDVAADITGADKTEYVRGINLICMKKNGQMYYYLFDAHGNVVQMVNQNGNIVNNYTYDEWGNTKSQTEGIENPFKYCGEYLDKETGLYYLRARYYDPTIGRFISEDSVLSKRINLFNVTEDVQDVVLTGGIYRNSEKNQYVIDDPLSLNLYTYCYNNPVIYSDPDGHFVIQTVCAAIGGVAGWHFGDYVAKKLGYSSGWKYWAIRSGVTVGGAVIGWFAGAAIANIAIDFLVANSSVTLQIPRWMFTGLGYYKALDNGVNFSTTAAQRMEQTGRFVPVNTLIDTIKNGTATADPKGSRAIMYYINMVKNGVNYKLEVLYDRSTNSIWHFMYSKK